MTPVLPLRLPPRWLPALLLALATLNRTAPCHAAVEVLAGTGAAGFFGDGGSPLRAQLNRPQAVALGADGSLFIADGGNRRVRRIPPGGLIVTVAGDGSAPMDPTWNRRQVGFPLALAAMGNGILIADGEGQRLLEWRDGADLMAPAGDGQESAALRGPASATPLLYPAGLLRQEGSVLVSEMGTGRILRISDAGDLTMLASGFAAPYGLAADVDGALLVAEYGAGRVTRWTPKGRSVALEFSSPGDEEPPRSRALPSSIVVARDGSLYVAAPDAGVVYRLPPNGPMEAFLAPPTVSRPTGLALDDGGRLLIADEGLNQVLAADLPGAAPLPGDVDDDGRLTVGDAVAALRLVTGLDPFNRRRFLAADLAPESAPGSSGDGRVTVSDVILLLRRVVAG